MDKIKPIQLPVRYDEKASQLVDAEGAAWLDVDYDDREICEAMVNQIADALNSAADKDRQIAAMTEALRLAVEFFNGIIRLHEANVELEVFKEIVTNEVFDPYNDVAKIRNILAESQRIQEGENG